VTNIATYSILILHAVILKNRGLAKELLSMLSMYHWSTGIIMMQNTRKSNQSLII